MKMELHACRNCQMINQVIESQTQKFNILSEENLTLHSLLVKARKSIRELSEKLFRSHEALVAERELNLQLYLKENNKPLRNEFTSEINTNDPSKTQKEHQKQEGNITQSSECRNLLTFIKEQQQNQRETLDVIYSENQRHTKLLNEHIDQAEEHVSVVLEFNKALRDDLFLQKKQNNHDRDDFLKTVDVLASANKKHLQEVRHGFITVTSRTVDKLTKKTINSLQHQLSERDKLVTILRRQQTFLKGEIEQLQDKEKTLKDAHQIVINKLKACIVYEQNKYSNLEQQRKFNAEGFHNDIKNIQQKIKALSSKFHKLPQDFEFRQKYKELVSDTDRVNTNLATFYRKSTASTL